MQEVDRETWLSARRALLSEEKAFSHARENLAGKRRALPAVRVEADYRFDTVRGEESLSELFEGRRQLIVQHFMFGPDWQQGCPSCSYWTDGFDRMAVHLAARDTTIKLVSAAPLSVLQQYRERMGWTLDWVSSGKRAFNPDFGVSFWPDGPPSPGGYNYSEHVPEGEVPGISVFARAPDGGILHTYSCYARGLDNMNAAYQLLDLTPLGRNEKDLPFTQAWVRRRDEYEIAVD